MVGSMAACRPLQTSAPSLLFCPSFFHLKVFYWQVHCVSITGVCYLVWLYVYMWGECTWRNACLQKPEWQCISSIILHLFKKFFEIDSLTEPDVLLFSCPGQPKNFRVAPLSTPHPQHCRHRCMSPPLAFYVHSGLENSGPHTGTAGTSPAKPLTHS